ncbi:hypothetical protein MKK58_06345 [Methylobacterium sp. J-078]|uniref:hypothetical protein n=1 Tax=Methylobacterium sp. J-078 TaxID=2836657 RepID=UPI001FBA2FAD|nr:hypothetical protein [Methylobacterium sp. J-078]MCJ2044151.1 hypothetical protein [Methylobacterium sp. J-078]
MTDATLIRIETQEATYLYAVETESAALDKFAATVGYDSYADLASTLGKSVDEAKSDLTVSTVSYREALSEIIDETLASDVDADGAEDAFESSKAWAAWCMQGKTGDDTRAFARDHNLDVNAAWYAVEDALRDRDLDDINAPFAEAAEEGTPSTSLFGDLSGKEPLVSNATLPEQFFHISGNDIYRYTYTGPHSYDVFERRDEGDRVIWIGCGAEHITYDTTADDLEAILG